jgi:hypothetical protein
MKVIKYSTQEEINDKQRVEKAYQTQVKLIIKLRLLCNFSLQTAADYTDLSPSTISRYENGENIFSSMKYLTICYAYEKYIAENHITYSQEILELACYLPHFEDI